MPRRATPLRFLALAAALALPPRAALAAPPAPTPVLKLAPAPALVPAASPTDASPGMTLDIAVQLALSRNERARISDLTVTIADAAVEKARAGFLPVFAFNVNNTEVGVLAPNQPANGSSGNLVLTQPLLNPSAYPLYAQAKALAEAQRAQNTDDKRLLAFNAASAFFAVLSDSAVVDAAQRQLENAQANLDDTQARAEAGLSSSNDVTRARVDLAGSGRELDVDKGALASAYVQISFLLNSPIGGPFAAPAAMLIASQQPLGPVDGLVRLALEQRPDVLVDKNDAIAAHDFAREPMMRLIPSVSLVGTASGTTSASASTRVWNQETVAGILSWTLYDAGSRYADKHARDAQAQIADLNLQQLVRSVDAQVRSAVAQLVAAQSEFQVAAEARDASQQNVDETAVLYRQGLAKAIELIDASDSRFASDVGYATARYSLALAYVNLRQAMGLGPLGTELK